MSGSFGPRSLVLRGGSDFPISQSWACQERTAYCGSQGLWGGFELAEWCAFGAAGYKGNTGDGMVSLTVKPFGCSTESVCLPPCKAGKEVYLKFHQDSVIAEYCLIDLNPCCIP